MENKNLKYDYSICDDCLIVNSIYVEQSHRKQGIGSSFIKTIEIIAKENKCKSIITPADLSKIALSFWMKNGFNPVDKESEDKVKRVMESKQNVNFIFDFNNNSVVELMKKI